MARKFLMVLGLVAALTLGSLAVAPQRQLAQAATTDSVVLVWNEEALESVRKLPPGPTVTARALAVVHTAIYDAWAAYDPVAVDTRQRLRANPGLRQPVGERTQANKERAVSFAAYTALVDLFPARTGVFDQRMATLGYATDGTDTSTPAMVGTTAAQAVLDFRHADGSNQLNGYSDTCDPACYQPVNTWDKILDADRWQPLCVPTPPPGATSLRRAGAAVPDPALAHRDPVRVDLGRPVPQPRAGDLVDRRRQAEWQVPGRGRQDDPALQAAGRHPQDHGRVLG